MSHITNSLAYRCMLSVTVGINMWKLVTHVTLLNLGKGCSLEDARPSNIIPILPVHL